MDSRRLPAIYGGMVLLAVLCACEQPANHPPSSAQIESLGMLALQAQRQADLDQLTRWAEQGMPVAQRELALAHAGHRPSQQTQANHWLQRAAARGDAQAQFELGKALHEGGLGLAQNFLQAWKWFELAARQGDGKASFMLARMASHGQGVAKDVEVSVLWLEQASRQGNAQAMYQLSIAYREGEGIPRNMMLARYWLTLSAEHDYSVAMQALAMELDGLGGQESPFAQHSRHLFKEASDHRLMRWNTHQ